MGNRAAVRRPGRSSVLTPSIVLGVWLAGAVWLSASGALRKSPRAPQAILILLTLLAGACIVLVPSVRKWARQVPLRLLIGWHLTRFIGFCFLYLYTRGQLPYDFAVKGGGGDILVALLAIPLLRVRDSHPHRRALVLGWNALGLVDILFVIATAGRLAGSQPGSMDALRQLPLGLVPTFLVPLILISHFTIGWRAATNRMGGGY